MEAQEPSKYSPDQMDSIKKNSRSVREFFLEDSKGVYDNNSLFYQVDDQTYFFSRLLRVGYKVELAKGLRDLVKFSVVPRELTNSLAMFDNENSAAVLADRLKKYKLTLDEGTVEMTESDLKKMSGNKKLYYPILTLYLGERIRKGVGGRWEIAVDPNFYIHVPVIKVGQQILEPAKMASDIFKHHLVDIGVVLKYCIASVKSERD